MTAPGSEKLRRHRPLLGRPLEALRAMAFGSPVYRLTLGGKQPDKLASAPTDPWPGDAERGREIAAGTWRFAGQAVQAPAKQASPEWFPAGASEAWLAGLHGFQWLRDLRETGGEGRGVGRHATADWIAECGAWERLAWRPDILGRRLAAWLTHGNFLLTNADALFRRRFLQSLVEQTRHLARVVTSGPEGVGRIAAIKALMFAGLTLPGGEKRLPQSLRLLDHELERQLMPDGGQVERNPSQHFQLMRDLVEMRLALIAARQPVPDGLQQAIDRAAPMLRFYRHGDGGLALFNGAVEERGELIDNVLALGQATGKPMPRAPHTGYERMAARKTLVLVDSGPPPPADWAMNAHAAPLAFEMSVGRERLVVNVGDYRGPDRAWRLAARATAAHSTVGVDDRNAVELRPDGSLGRRPREVAVERHEADGATWIEMSHDGYRPTHRIVHWRRLWLAADGDDLRGEDVLDGPGGEQFTLRFHLHPEVKAAVVQDGASVLLRTASGAGWRLRAKGGVVSLAESVYLGEAGETRRTEQVVVSGGLNGERTEIKWALTRVPAKQKRTRRRSEETFG